LGAEELTPTERVDAVVCGDEIGSELAEELELLAPFGAGNPEVSLLLRGATLHDARPMGEGRHLRFTVTAGGVRSRAVCFGSDRLATTESEPADATFRLELNEFRGVVEPRLVLRCAQPCRPEPIECLDLDESYLTSVWRELDAALEPEPMRHDLPRRCVIDRRGRPPAGAISRLVASGERVLVLCADSERRRAHLDGSLGGFALCSHNGLARAPHYAESYDHVVVLDPPAHPADDARLAQGRTTQCTHLAWGEPELRFAELVHEHEYGLRASLATLYRALRAAGGADAHSLEGLLRGPAAARSGAQAGRMLRVLAELGLIAVDRDQGRVALLSGARTELERSPSFVAYERRLKDGRRFLRSATAQAA
jgi:single-stranded-DNA-specific exonuclease